MERELLRQSKKGDKHAFSKLVLSYYKRVFRTAYLIVQNRCDAEDITQTAFLKAYSNIRKFDESKSFFPWIHKITKNIALNHIHKQSIANEKISELITQNNLDCHDNSPEEKLLKETSMLEDTKRLISALEKLPKQMQDILILKHWKECSYREISDIMEIPLGTVMSRLHYARKKLKETIEKNDKPEEE